MVLTVWMLRRSSVAADPPTVAAFRRAFVASWVGVGLYTWRRRPSSRLGPLFIGAGLLCALISLAVSVGGLSYTLGHLLNGAFVVYLVALSVAFPRDRIAARSERQFMITFAAVSGAAWVLALALSERLPAGGPFVDCARRCPDNALAIVTTSPSVFDVQVRRRSAAPLLCRASRTSGRAASRTSRRSIATWTGRRRRRRSDRAAFGERFTETDPARSRGWSVRARSLKWDRARDPGPAPRRGVNRHGAADSGETLTEIAQPGPGWRGLNVESSSVVADLEMQVPVRREDDLDSGRPASCLAAFCSASEQTK